MNFLEMWYTAANTKDGACFSVSNYESIRQQLYTCRKGAADPELDGLTIVQSPINPSHLWIIKRGKPVPRNPTNIIELKI